MLALAAAAGAALLAGQQAPPSLRLTVFGRRDHAVLRIGEAPRHHHSSGDAVGHAAASRPPPEAQAAPQAISWAVHCSIIPAAGGASIWSGNATAGATPATALGPAGPPPPPLVQLSLLARPAVAPAAWGLAKGTQTLYVRAIAPSSRASRDV